MIIFNKIYIKKNTDNKDNFNKEFVGYWIIDENPFYFMKNKNYILIYFIIDIL